MVRSAISPKFVQRNLGASLKELKQDVKICDTLADHQHSLLRPASPGRDMEQSILFSWESLRVNKIQVPNKYRILTYVQLSTILPQPISTTNLADCFSESKKWNFEFFSSLMAHKQESITDACLFCINESLFFVSQNTKE